LKIENNNKTIKISIASRKLQEISSALIVLFVALMAISQMINGNLEEQIMITHNKTGNYSSWYQSKSVKQILKENQLDYLESLAATENISTKKLDLLNSKIEETKKLTLKYEAEKTELLVGSSNVPREYWAQDLDGVMGAIVGLKEWQKLSNEYGIASKKFDYALFFYQVSIMLGVICIIIKDNISIQKIFAFLMVIAGTIATLISIYGYTLIP